MHKKTVRIKPSRVSMLALFVFVVCILLFFSIAISGAVLYCMISIEILPPLIERRLPVFILFLWMVSLFVGIVIAISCGRRILRPIIKMMDAAKEIASGNFDVWVEAAGVREINQLAESFNAMAKELSGMETLRSDFIGTISHEFKTPIVSIRGFARRLRKDSTLSREQQNAYLDIIISESERLTSLSSNILLLLKLESMEMVVEKTPYFLGEQIRRTILLLEPQLKKKAFVLDIMLEKVEITANEELLSHLFINLLGNTIKFSPDGGTIKIVLKQEAGNAVVHISDTGIGMSDAVKKRIFDKFYQVDRSGGTDGNGLGLPLVKRILELVNGSISVDSELGKGTCFTVSLPIRS